MLFYLLDLFSIFNLYSAYRQLTEQKEISQVEISLNELEELEQERYKKMIESFEERELQISNSKFNLKEQEEKLKQKNFDLELARKKLESEINQLKKQKEEESQYQKKINNIATAFSSMEPQRVVERIEEMKDNRMIIDILNSMNKLAASQDKKSIVPFLLSLMDKKKSAEILELSTLPNYNSEE